MDVERGVRRIVIVLSVLSAVAALALIGNSKFMTLYWNKFYRDPVGEHQRLQNRLRVLEQKAEALRAKPVLSRDERQELEALEKRVIPVLAKQVQAGPAPPTTLWIPPELLILAGTVLAGAVPWIVWYLLRWIVRGFLNTPKAN
jgi:hypothetical protein